MRILAGALVAVALLGACGDDDDGDASPGLTALPSTTTSTTAAPAGSSTTSTATTAAPAPDADPSAAAAAFLATFFPDNRATLGEFRQGDNQSGEVDVFRPSEAERPGDQVASTLLLRVVDGEWQVLGAANPDVTIDTPENGAEVDAGPLTVSGVGRGFEATIVAQAFGLDGGLVTEGIGSAGAFEESEPYEIVLDLSTVEPATEVVVIVAGGTGLDGDPGEFSAVRVTT